MYVLDQWSGVPDVDSTTTKTTNDETVGKLVRERRTPGKTVKALRRGSDADCSHLQRILQMFASVVRSIEYFKLSRRVKVGSHRSCERSSRQQVWATCKWTPRHCCAPTDLPHQHLRSEFGDVCRSQGQLELKAEGGRKRRRGHKNENVEGDNMKNSTPIKREKNGPEFGTNREMSSK